MLLKLNNELQRLQALNQALTDELDAIYEDAHDDIFGDLFGPKEARILH